MKNIVLIALVFQSAVLFCQTWGWKSTDTFKGHQTFSNDFIPIVTPANEWVADYLFPSFPVEIRRYTFSVDSTLLLGRYYRELIFSKNMNSGPWYGTERYFREEDGRVYTKWKTGNLPERLLYDMHFGVGDTLVPNTEIGQGDRKIVEVGMIELLDSVPRKYLLLESSLCFGTTMWIEGMGDVEQLFWTEIFCSLGEDGPPVLIRCFSTNGQLLYKRADVDGCYVSSATDVDLQTIKVYPNPASDFLFLDLPDMSIVKEISLFNAFGQTAGNFPDTSIDGRIDIAHLPAGIYSGIARFKDAAPRSFKIVKTPKPR